MASRDQCEAFFKEADKNGDGYLSYSELADMMRSKGFKGSDEEIKKYFITADTSGDDRISLEEYLIVMGELPPRINKEASMRFVFRSFDKDSNGLIDRQELKTVFKEMGRHLSEEEVTKMMQLMDTNQDGMVNYEEFISYFFCQ